MPLYALWCFCHVLDALDILSQEFARSVCRCWNASNNSSDAWGEWSYTTGKALDSFNYVCIFYYTCIDSACTFCAKEKAVLVIWYYLLLFCCCSYVNIVVFPICPAWTNGLRPRSGSRGFLCLQQGWADGRQLSVGPHEWVWWWSSAIGDQMVWEVHGGWWCGWIQNAASVFWMLITPF